MHTVNLDEYVGLAPENEQSYYCFMLRNFFNHVNIYPANTNIPYGLNPNAEDECRRYDAVIRALGGIDLHVSAEGRDVIIIVPTVEMKGSYRMGDPLHFSFQGNVAHVFSKETDKNLEF